MFEYTCDNCSITVCNGVQLVNELINFGGMSDGIGGNTQNIKDGSRAAWQSTEMKKGYSADMQCGMKRQVHIKWHMRFVPIGTVQTVA